MKAFTIGRSCMFAVLAVTCPVIALAQATGPAAFIKKPLDNADSVPALHAPPPMPAPPMAGSAPGKHDTTPLAICSREKTLIAELEKTVALQSKRIAELEADVKLAGRGAAK